MTETQTQERQILLAMQSGRKIDPMSALNDYGCFRLGARCFDLKAQGYPIESEWFETPSGKRCKRYYIPSQPRLIKQ